MFNKKTEDDDSSFWLSYTDLITGFMVVFIILVLWYSTQNKDLTTLIKEKDKYKKQLNALDTLANVYKNYKKELYNELNSKLGKKLQDWNASLTEDLLVRFNDADVLFDLEESTLKPKFKTILDEFLPIYFGVLSEKKDITKYISQIRIEGHTAGNYKQDTEHYMKYIILSQNRSNNVLKYFMFSPFFRHLANDKKANLIFLLSSNGLSFGKTIDDNGIFTFQSGKQYSDKSRRVEFKIITTDEKILDQVYKIIDNKN